MNSKEFTNLELFTVITLKILLLARCEEPKRDKNVNLNIEAVLEFRNNNSGDAEVIDSARKFLDKLKLVVQKGANESRRAKQKQTKTKVDDTKFFAEPTPKLIPRAGQHALKHIKELKTFKTYLADEWEKIKEDPSIVKQVITNTIKTIRNDIFKSDQNAMADTKYVPELYDDIKNLYRGKETFEEKIFQIAESFSKSLHNIIDRYNVSEILNSMIKHNNNGKQENLSSHHGDSDDDISEEDDRGVNNRNRGTHMKGNFRVDNNKELRKIPNADDTKSANKTNDLEKLSRLLNDLTNTVKNYLFEYTKQTKAILPTTLSYENSRPEDSSIKTKERLSLRTKKNTKRYRARDRSQHIKLQPIRNNRRSNNETQPHTQDITPPISKDKNIVNTILQLSDKAMKKINELESQLEQIRTHIKMKTNETVVTENRETKHSEDSIEKNGDVDIAGVVG